MPTQTIETGVLGFAVGAEPSGAFAEDMAEVVVCLETIESEWEISRDWTRINSGVLDKNA
jgi:hypothetical protein